MTDPLNSYEEPIKEPIGTAAQRHAENAAAVIRFLGGPTLNPDALAKILIDLRTWWIK